MENMYPKGKIFLLQGQIFIHIGKYLSIEEIFYP
jgi:hypothetical protein